MTRKDFVNIVGPLALQFRYEMDKSQWQLLHEAVEDIPGHLLVAAVKLAAKQRKWFPKPAEIREDAEACRAELRAALKFEPCASCSSDGWTETVVDGVRRMTRCACWKAHQAKIADLGIGEPLALPAGRASDFEQVGE